MFWDDIVLVTEQIEKYGLRRPFADLGGLENPCIADYELTILTGDQQARYVSLEQRPFDHIDPDYIILNPEKGDPPIEDLPSRYSDAFGTAVCLNVIEHVENPFEVFSALFQVMKQDSLLIVETVFSFPYHPSPRDYWRYSPDCLKHLGTRAGFTVLEAAWRIDIPADKGIRNTQNGSPQEIRSVYAALAKGHFVPRPGPRYKLPRRISKHPEASKYLNQAQTNDGNENPASLWRNERHPESREETSKPPLIQPRKPACLFINTYYPAFLLTHYNRNPELARATYAVQLQALQEEAFGDSDFYSRGLRAAGWQAEDLIVNCDPLQQAWARENQSTSQGPAIALEQIRRKKPQVVYIQDINAFNIDFLNAIRPHVQLIVGQIACPISEAAPLNSYDILVSSFPHYVKLFREKGHTAYYQPLAFDVRVLEKVPPRAYQERRIDCSFVGGLSAAHSQAGQLFEYLAQKTPIQFWGYGLETLPEDSLVRPRHGGEVWGRQMFEKLSNSKIVVNRHIDVAANFANNMRLFEATGCGALLITDYKDNLGELFSIGEEVVAYRSAEECALLIQYYLDNPSEAEAIARAGQARTLREHSYQKRMLHTAEFLERHLRYKQEKSFYPRPAADQISSAYSEITPREINAELIGAWQHEELPRRQRALVQWELEQMYRGEGPAVYGVLADILRPVVSNGSTLLEIGCSSGYYYEILEYLLNKRIAYTGVDYSAAMIEMARSYYPKARFVQADGADLPFSNEEFEIAVSSCVLLHTPDYPDQIKETSRVARTYVVAHRTPVCRKRSTQYLKKLAYGVETVELLFNESELLKLFEQTGLRLIQALQYEGDDALDRYGVTYLFEKRRSTV